MSELHFNLKAWRAWAPDRATLQAWQEWAGTEGSGTDDWPQAETLPMMLRRRAGPLGQRAIASALACRGDGSERYVFASRHGELDRTVGILRALAGDEAPSPAEFSMSVHHAMAGLLSIHTGNRQGHTAVAAGVDTFGFGFLESLGVLAAEPGASVLLVYCDTALPHEYAELDPTEDTEPLVLALHMTASAEGAPVYAFAAQPAPLSGGPIDAKQAPRDFLRFLLRGVPSARSTGARMDWRWRRVA